MSAPFITQLPCHQCYPMNTTAVIYTHHTPAFSTTPHCTAPTTLQATASQATAPTAPTAWQPNPPHLWHPNLQLWYPKLQHPNPPHLLHPNPSLPITIPPKANASQPAASTAPQLAAHIKPLATHHSSGTHCKFCLSGRDSLRWCSLTV